MTTTTTTPHFDIIVPIYYCDQSLYLTIDTCLKALAEHYPNCRVITVDDGSPLPTAQWQPTVILSRNGGYTAAVNAGLEKSKSRVIVIMNDDIVVQAGQLDRFAELRGLQIASPLDTSGSADDRFGACFGMTRQVYDLLGPLDDDFKHFYSDLDYYLRAKDNGVAVIKWTDIILDHPESTTYKVVNKEKLYEQDNETYIKRTQG